eukprot:1081672_1
MSQRQSRQAKHIQSIQKIFTQYDDKLQMHPPSPQPPTSPYSSSRFAIHRPKSPNGPRRNHTHAMHNTKRVHENELEPPKPMNNNEPSPVISIGSMFDSNKKSSIADLHKQEETAFRFSTNINIPDVNNTEIVLDEFEKETKTLTSVCTNYENIQTSLSQIVRQQSLCIKQLLKELDKKNHQIKELQNLLSIKSESGHTSPHKTVIISPKNSRINRKFQKHSMNKKRLHKNVMKPPNVEYEEIIRHVPIHNI